MVEIKRLDLDLFQSEHLHFRDDGPLNEKAKTRRYSVFSRKDRSLLGYIKWHGPWHQYVFFPLNSLFNDGCMRQIAQFLTETNKAFRDRRLDAAQRKATKTRRINKLERLTHARTCAIMDSLVKETEEYGISS